MEALATSVDKTPEQPPSAACLGPRDRFSRSVAIPFEANVLGLRENEHILIIVSVDWFSKPALEGHKLSLRRRRRRRSPGEK